MGIARSALKHGCSSSIRTFSEFRQPYKGFIFVDMRFSGKYGMGQSG
jgi:hypothetical protein